MKKKILFLLAFIVLACTFCMVAMAQDVTYYLYDDGTELPSGENNVSVSQLYWQSEENTGVFANLKEGDNVVFNLMENISYTPTTSQAGMSNNPNTSNALRISVPATVTVNFGEYSWWFTNNDAYDAFVLDDENAKLNLIGTKALDKNGQVKELDNNYSVSTVDNKVDVFSNFVVAYMKAGYLYCEGLAMVSREEPIFQKEGYLTGYSLVECVNTAIIATSNFPSIGLTGKGNSKNDLKLDNVVCGTVVLHNPLENTYIKNSLIKETCNSNALYIDSWKNRNAYELPIENSTVNGRYWAECDANKIVASNSSFGILYLKGDSTGGAYVELTDSTYTSVDFCGKSGQLTVITSADCTKAGSMIVYNKDNTSGIVDTSYNAPILPHTLNADAISQVAYANGYCKEGTYTSSCSVCGTENCQFAAPALITWKGFSVPDDGDIEIVSSYYVNKDAVAIFEKVTENTITYGIVVGLKQLLGENNPLDANGDAIELENSTVIKVDVDKTMTSFEFKLTDMEGYETEKFVIAAYVIAAEDESVSVVYLQESQLINSLGSIDYNTVLENSNSSQDD